MSYDIFLIFALLRNHLPSTTLHIQIGGRPFLAVNAATYYITRVTPLWAETKVILRKKYLSDLTMLDDILPDRSFELKLRFCGRLIDARTE